MASHLNIYNNKEELEAALGSGDLEKPYVVLFDDSGETLDWNTEQMPTGETYYPLTFEIISESPSVFRFSYLYPSIGSDANRVIPIEYSLNGEDWTSFTVEKNKPLEINVEWGDTVALRANETKYTWCSFSSSTCEYNLKGNIMSLLYGKDYYSATTLQPYAFSQLFQNCYGLRDASQLLLPATTLANSCYSTMFISCSGMTGAPELPASALAISCYNNMFLNCSSLEVAPELPAATLPDRCYNGMFYGCTSLEYIKCLATGLTGTNCTKDWTKNVPSGGTFIKDSNMSAWTENWGTSYSGVPAGWLVMNEDYKDYELSVTYTVSGAGKTQIAIEETFDYSGVTLNGLNITSGLEIEDGVIYYTFPSAGSYTFKWYLATDTIPDYAFEGIDITEVSIPPCVTEIGTNSFASNPITSLTLSEGLERIGDYAFEASHLSEITIPSTVTFIGDGAFDVSPYQDCEDPSTGLLVILKPTTPPELEWLDKVFGLQRIARYVFPADGWSNYKEDESWMYLYNISRGYDCSVFGAEDDGECGCYLCFQEGLCWDVDSETCVECDECQYWEEMGYLDYEDCRCAEYDECGGGDEPEPEEEEPEE